MAVEALHAGIARKQLDFTLDLQNLHLTGRRPGRGEMELRVHGVDGFGRFDGSIAHAAGNSAVAAVLGYGAEEGGSNPVLLRRYPGGRRDKKRQEVRIGDRRRQAERRDPEDLLSGGFNERRLALLVYERAGKTDEAVRKAFVTKVADAARRAYLETMHEVPQFPDARIPQDEALKHLTNAGARAVNNVLKLRENPRFNEILQAISAQRATPRRK